MEEEKKQKHPGGRPTDYTIELAEEICEKIATESKGLKRICEENEHFPERRTIFRWLFRHEEFCHMYDKAKLAQTEVLQDDMIEIADDTSHDVVMNDNGKMVCNSEYVNRARLRIDTRKWNLERLKPKKYGARLEQTHDVGTSLMQAVMDKL